MKKILVDQNVSRKNDLIISQENVKKNKSDFLPSIIEFSSSGLCNRKCFFCPRSSPDYEHVNNHLSIKNIEKISEELSSYNKDFYFLFSGFSEPLLTKHLEDLIGIIRKKHKKSTIEINTNTDLLNRERIISLFKSGLTSIRCSIYDNEERLKEVGKLLEDCGVDKSSYSLRARYFSKDKDGEKALSEFGINLSNRAGMMENALYSIPALKEPLKKPCYYPFYNMFIDYNGDYLICPHDWGKGELLGNIQDHHVINDIWLSDRANEIRSNLLESKREVSEACKKCDVPGDFMGLEQAKEWRKLWKT